MKNIDKYLKDKKAILEVEIQFKGHITKNDAIIKQNLTTGELFDLYKDCDSKENSLLVFGSYLIFKDDILYIKLPD